MAPNMQSPADQAGADQSTDQTSDQTTDNSDDMSGGFCIELRVTADGKMSIGVESLDDEAAEEGGEGGSSDEDYQPVKSLQEAFKLIKEIVAHGGNQQDMQASASDMASGYGQ